MPPFLTEEEIDQLINIQTASESSHNHNFSNLSPVNLACHKSENRCVDQFEEKQSDSPMCMVDDISFVNDSPRFDQYVDDCDFQTDTNCAEHSAFDFWEEARFHKLEKSEQALQVIYDTDEDSLESLEVSEESQTLFSTSLQSIRDNIHIIGDQQCFSFDDELEEDDEFLEHVVNERPFPEIVEEVILDTESSLTLDLQPQSSIESQIADEEKEADKHMRVVSLPFQDNLLSQCILAHQPDDLHIVFSPLN